MAEEQQIDYSELIESTMPGDVADEVPRSQHKNVGEHSMDYYIDQLLSYDEVAMQTFQFDSLLREMGFMGNQLEEAIEKDEFATSTIKGEYYYEKFSNEADDRYKDANVAAKQSSQMSR